MQKSDGMNYAPVGKAQPVVGRGEFKFAAIALDHGHINGMCNGLTEAGAELKWVYDPDPAKVAAFVKHFPQAQPARSEAEIFDDGEVRLVAGAAVPCDRCALGLRAIAAGKDYFTDKAPFTTLEQLASARAAVAQTGRKYMVYYSERLHVESAVFAGRLVREGAIGKVIEVTNLAPHRLSASSRPAWFFQKEKYGGILCDIGSHQIEQFLFFSGSRDAEVMTARVANVSHPEYPELEDYGMAVLKGDTGAIHMLRVDWFTPDKLSVWGDGRLFVLGTEGYMEVRKYVDLCRDKQGNQVYLVNRDGEQHFSLSGKQGFPYFGQLVRDCIDRTENAMTQEHAFKAAELCLKAQALADRADVR